MTVTETGQGQRPNILFIMADQLAPQFLPMYGHPLVQTPHLSALANRGTVFENAYSNFPLCVPSRASMLAGRYANAIGCWDNAMEMPAAVPTMAHYLRSVGYHSVLCGKMHFIGPDQLHGFNERLTTDIYPSNFAWTPDWTQGDRPTGISMRGVVEAGKCKRSLQIDYDDEVEFNGIQGIFDLARYHREQPFFLTISFTHPHSPFVTTDKYWDLYDHDAIDMPGVGAIELEKLDAFSRWLYYAHARDRHTVTEEHVRTARHAYYGMVSYIDDKVGRIMQTLKDADLFDNTVVIFSADHGEMLGERGMWYKQAMFENSSRVPMIIADPNHETVDRNTRNVSLVDLLPTMMDIACDGNVPTPASSLDGDSLVPLLKSRNSEWNNAVISEYTGEGTCAPIRMLRRDDYKFVYTHGQQSQLYDLSNDPLELSNLVDDPQHSNRATAMKEELLTDWNPEHIEQAARNSQRERLFIQDSTGGEPNWAYVARLRDDARYVRNAGAVQTKGKARLPYYDPVPFER